MDHSVESRRLKVAKNTTVSTDTFCQAVYLYDVINTANVAVRRKCMLRHERTVSLFVDKVQMKQLRLHTEFRSCVRVEVDVLGCPS